jgi:hypothetical protein
MPAKLKPGRAGDWIEVHLPGGGPPRLGRITQVLGRPGHEHYRVHWTDGHESIHYPADGSLIVAASRVSPRHDGARVH